MLYHSGPSVRPCSRVFANSQNAPLTFGMSVYRIPLTDFLEI